ncbi:hypothetical protein Tco_0223614 [Tanacetum coccineum]
MVVLMLSYSIKVMDLNSSLGKICLGENVVEISSDKIEGSRDWNSPVFQDTANSGQKKETKAMVFYQIDTEEVSDRFVAPCFVNGLEAYDGEINLGVEENMISNEYAVKLCLEHEVKRGNKVVKKEFIVALRGEFYFVKFIINPEDDDVEPGVILRRSFLRMTKAITDFEAGTVTIYPEIDPFLEDIEEKEKSLDNWDHLLDFNLDNVPLLGEEELPPFICKMGKSSRNKKRAMENLNFFLSRYRNIFISWPIIETMAYHDKYKKILNEIWKDKVELDGKIVKEEEEAVKSIKDTGSDINTMPYQIYKQLGREDMKKVDRGITMINHTQEEAMGILTNVLCHVGVTTLIAMFLILDIPIDRDAPIVIKRNKFGAPIYGPKPAPYLNCNDLTEQSLAIQTVTNPFQKISVWKKAVSFLGSLPIPLKHVNCKPSYKGSYTKEDEATRQWRTEIRLTDPYGNIYLQGFTTKKTDRKLSKDHKLSDIMSPNLWEHTMMRPDHHDPNNLDNMKPWKRMGYVREINDMLRIRLREAGSDEEIFTSVAWIRAFNINEPIYAELCHEFYSTYEFDEFCADDELQTKKIIKFRLGGRAYSLTLLEFTRRLGLYHADELEEDGFNVYFEGGLRSDEHFNAQETTGYDKIQKNDLWLLSMFDARHQNGVLTKDVVRSLSALIYCKDLDTTLLRDLIDSEGKLIPEDPQPGVPRVGIPRPPRASMQDLYNRMGRMEIRQEDIKRMEYRQSYHWDRYQGVFEHMAGVYSVPLQGAYNPPGYAQPQYDQYYQQYPPPPPQYQQQ